MKSKLSVLLLCVLFAQAAVAQLNLGIKAGANISKIDGRSFSDEFRYGYHLGGFLEIGLGKKVTIQPEVLFNQFQTRASSNFRDVYQNAFENTGDIQLNYLSIPLLLNYKLGNVLSLQAGPQYGILMNKGETVLDNGREAFRSGDFSMLGGAQLYLGKLRLTGRYAVGLDNLNDIDNQNEWNSQAWQLSIGYAF